uniref:Uncharacterized protein n=1 Tax=Anguilla anguilla TaxID=7936 RepID=A0A0E9QK54_ANGAN
MVLFHWKKLKRVLIHIRSVPLGFQTVNHFNHVPPI